MKRIRNNTERSVTVLQFCRSLDDHREISKYIFIHFYRIFQVI